MAAGCAQHSGYDPDELLFCGDRLVYAMQVGEHWSTARPAWSWSAATCEQIRPTHREWFRTTDECKPVLDGSHVLITSSAGGAALVRRADGVCRFYAQSRNAHSAELIRGKWIAVASSYKGDELQIYDMNDRRQPAEKIAVIPLIGAHGVVYDWRNDVLWALGGGELLKTRITEQENGPAVEIEVLERFDLPKGGGHDLYPYFHYQHKGSGLPTTARGLFVTVNETVFVFDLETCEFTKFEPLAGQRRVKSITDHLWTGRIAYQQAQGPNWWSQAAKFLQPDQVRLLPGQIGAVRNRIYKIRWNQPNPFSYEQDVSLVKSRRFSMRPEVIIVVSGGFNL